MHSRPGWRGLQPDLILAARCATRQVSVRLWGLRPSQGRIASDPGETAFNRLSMEGPMARNVNDAAMLLDVMAGYDRRDPMSLDDRGVF